MNSKPVFEIIMGSKIDRSDKTMLTFISTLYKSKNLKDQEKDYYQKLCEMITNAIKNISFDCYEKSSSLFYHKE